ncbi:TAXI family TRAP transporter solute-binding subunit [Maridesulfovibrio sp.]|uniref:TAXI family TRAP transporter solute-binding subunit n=1 Tax=Maridesulfovibrio sp. TaxID=2795000 RepID=UPI0029F5029D|nr:TAXI family TRAP transporter solute-binding subunit [Maridesulfovibrio sp.]
MLNKFSFLIFVCALCLGFTTTPSHASANKLTIATATPGGTYYPVGVAIGTLLSIKLAKKHQITATAINSAGAAENIQMLKNGKADLAILQALCGINAYKGKGAHKGKAFKEFRSITMLWENVEHFPLLRKYAKTGDISDLNGLQKNFSIGTHGSGTEVSGCTLLKTLGINIKKDFELEFMDYNHSAQAMIDGRIAGANIPAGPPVAAVNLLYTQLGSDKITVLEFTDAQLEKIQKSYPIWSRYVIPAGTYPSQDKAINTVSQSNFLACRADLPEAVVYEITKTIFENLPFLNNTHDATKAISLKRATAGLPVPLHPGAEKFYREAGVIN